MKERQVQFGEGTKEGPGEEEEELDPGTAHRLYQEGGFLVVSNKCLFHIAYALGLFLQIFFTS